MRILPTVTHAQNNLCNASADRRDNRYCQASCFYEGNGYDGDECCSESA
jgi:hypothetical protein